MLPQNAANIELLTKYPWAVNPIKLQRAIKFLEDRQSMGHITEYEEADIKAKYVEFGGKVVKPRVTKARDENMQALEEEEDDADDEDDDLDVEDDADKDLED